MKGVNRKVSNVGFKSRIRQVLILIGAILIGMIISCAADAQDFHKAKKRHFRAKYRNQISVGNNACHILNKKRNMRHRAPLFAVRYRKLKYAPLAEVDTPVAESHTPKFRRNDPLVASAK